VLGRARKRFNRTGTSACIRVHPFLICVEILSRGQSSVSGLRKDFNADKKGMNADARRCFRTMFRSGEIPLRSGLSLIFNRMIPDRLSGISGFQHAPNVFGDGIALLVGGRRRSARDLRHVRRHHIPGGRLAAGRGTRLHRIHIGNLRLLRQGSHRRVVGQFGIRYHPASRGGGPQVGKAWALTRSPRPPHGEIRKIVLWEHFANVIRSIRGSYLE
jgi:hypothetical protein